MAGNTKKVFVGVEIWNYCCQEVFQQAEETRGKQRRAGDGVYFTCDSSVYRLNNILFIITPPSTSARRHTRAVKEQRWRNFGCFSSRCLWGAHSCPLSRWSCCISVCQNNFPVCTRRGPLDHFTFHKMLSESKRAGRARACVPRDCNRGLAAAAQAGTIKAELP